MLKHSLDKFMLHSPIKELKRWLRTGILAILLFTLSLGLSAAWWDTGDKQPARESLLPPGDAITDGKALLRYALPIDNQPVRRIQASLENISTPLRARRWPQVSAEVGKAETALELNQAQLLEGVPENRQSQAEPLIARIQSGLNELQEVVETQDKERVLMQQDELLGLVGQLEALMVEGFPFEVPEEYNKLPQLRGRATVEIKTNKGTITTVVDGYNAPITAGNFVDLVQRGFYDGLEFTRVEQYYVAQVGDPPGDEDGFVDPETGEYRTIPLEVKVQSEKEPIYGFTLEEIGLYRERPALPFSAFGAIAMARPDSDPNGGSSQFFFFLFESEMTPAGLNLLDGQYSVFGYAVAGTEVLDKLKEGDEIESAKVIEGAENLVEPQAI